VVLPDHFHCVLTLLPGDDDFSNRIKAIKVRFVRAIKPSERRSSVRVARGESQGQGWPCRARRGCNAASGNADFGNLRFAMTRLEPA